MDCRVDFKFKKRCSEMRPLSCCIKNNAIMKVASLFRDVHQVRV